MNPSTQHADMASGLGRLCVQTANKGIDNLIAATALCHNLTIVTRNTKHFEPTGVCVLNPFYAQ